MFQEIMKRKDVLSFLDEIEHNERYFQKTSRNLFDHSFFVSKEQALFIFYEALFQYQVLFLDDTYLEEYLLQLRKVYKKFDCFEDIREGIHKILCKMLCVKLHLEDLRQKESREQLITYVYEKYVVDGYYIHGFASSYQEAIRKDHFTPEEYDHFYDRFIKAREILDSYRIRGVITKDFDNKKVYFTGDMVMGCYYSLYSPMFFYKFIRNCDYFGRRIRKDYYLKGSISLVMSHLKRFLNSRDVKENDQKFILDLVQDEWNFLHREKKEISLLLVKKKLFHEPVKSLEEFLEDTRDIYELIDSILSSKNNNISYQETLEKDQYEVVSLPFYDWIEENELEKKLSMEEKEEEVSFEFLNAYGNVSLLLLLGSMFVTIGVLISIFMVLRG